MQGAAAPLDGGGCGPVHPGLLRPAPPPQGDGGVLSYVPLTWSDHVPWIDATFSCCIRQKERASRGAVQYFLEKHGRSWRKASPTGIQYVTNHNSSINFVYSGTVHLLCVHFNCFVFYMWPVPISYSVIVIRMLKFQILPCIMMNTQYTCKIGL